MKRQRKTLVDRLEQSGKEYATYLLQHSADELLSKRSPTEWSIHQVAAHMRDTDQFAFLVRVERLLKENDPAFANFDQETYWASHSYSPAEPIKRIVADLLAARRKMVRLLRAAPDAAWKRTGIHSAYGKVSLDWVAMHCYHHTLEHTAQSGYVLEKELLKSLNR
jgi:hypothetical protein